MLQLECCRFEGYNQGYTEIRKCGALPAVDNVIGFKGEILMGNAEILKTEYVVNEED